MSLKPTKEEWDKFIEILSRPYGTVDCRAKLYKETKYYPFRSQKWQKALTHYPKKQRNELRDRCVITITPLFSSAAGIKSRWLKTCEDIELIF